MKKGKIRKKITSMLLAFTMLSSLFGGYSIKAEAAEAIVLQGDTFTTNPGEGFKFEAEYYCKVCGRTILPGQNIVGHTLDITSFTYTISNGNYSWNATAKVTSCVTNDKTIENKHSGTFVCDSLVAELKRTDIVVSYEKKAFFDVYLTRYITRTHQGDATCETADNCALCGTSYTNPDNHEKPDEFIYSVSDSDNTKHDKKYACCEGIVETTEHSNYTYSKTADNIITAKCDDCSYETSLTLSAPANLTYDGAEKAATIEGNIVNVTTPTITYTKDGAPLDGTPVDVGTYTASIGIDNVTASVTYEIVKADAQITVGTSSYEKTYGDEAFTLDVTDNNPEADIVYTVLNSQNVDGDAVEDNAVIVVENGMVTIKGAGTATISVSLPESTHYKAVSADVSVQVDKATPECEAPKAIEELTYTGLAQELITEGEVTEGCIMEYKLGEDGTYSSEIPQAKEAGTYTVYWKTVGNDNYEDYESPTGVDVTIKKATPTLTWEDQTVVANGKAAEITAPTATFIGEDSPEVNYTYAHRVQGEGDYTDGLPSACGTYDIKGIIAETDNYGIAEKNMTLTIECTDENTDGFCDYCGSPVEVEAVDGWYPIANKGNLLWFASAVNAGQTTMNAKLTADIDLEGAKWSIMNSFAGTIEGNGHTIKGLCLKAGLSDGKRHGFIRVLESTGVVKNLTFKEADVFNHEGDGSTTSVIAYTNLGTVENCIVKDSTIQHGNYDSMSAVVANNYGTIKNCASISNKLSRRYSSVKAKVGFVWKNNGVITGCYSYDCKYEGSGDSYAFTGINNGRMIDCYYYENDTVSDLAAVSMSAEQFASGEATFLLNGSTNTGNVSWYQNLTGEGTDVYPVLESTHGTVYYVFKCDGVTPIYRNVNENEPHVDEDDNGFCDNCDKLPTSVKTEGKVELNSNVLTYGEALSKLKFKKVSFVNNDGKALKGTLAWDNPEAKPDVRDTHAVWVFTPEDEEYQVVRGTVAIVVNKAVPKVTVLPTVDIFTYTPGKKLGSVALKDATVTGVEENTLAGKWNWKETEITPVVNNDGYVAVFTPQDDMHYETIEETIRVPIRKADANLTIGRTSYSKDFTSKAFALTDIRYTGDGILTYSVDDEKTLDGEAKAAGSVISVSDDGRVTIKGAGSANIYVGVAESDNYMAAKPQVISVNIGLVDGFFVDYEKEHTYTGKAIKPEVVVYDGLNGVLTKDKDYTVTYKNNTNVGGSMDEADFDSDPMIIVEGKGVYSTKISVPFRIVPKDISDMDESIVVKEILLEENGNVQKKIPSITYNKKALKGVLKSKDGSTLEKGKDFVYSYVYSYPNMKEEEIADNAFKSAGTWKIYVEGTGNYTGERYVDVVIATKGGKMSSAKIKSIPTQEYTGKAIELTAEELQVTGKIDGTNQPLTKDTHYKVSYKNNVEIGTATVTLTGIPSAGFSGTKSATFKIAGTSIAKAKVEGISAKTYNAKAQTQDVKVTVTKKVETESGTQTQNVTLVKGKDYTVSYEKNVNVGTAKMTIKGIGAYTGTINKTFKINRYDITGETDAHGKTKLNSPLSEVSGLFSLEDGALSVKLVKGGAKPSVKLFFNGTVLTEGKDYTLSYKNNKNVYTQTEGDEGYKKSKAPALTIKGKGNFEGSVSKTFVITGRKLAEAGQEVTMTVADKAASTAKGGYISKPVLTDADGKVLTQGKDYTAPVYTMKGENGETVTLDKKAKVTELGTEITVTVKGLGAYAADAEEEMSATYVLTEKNFTNAKVSSIIKPYTGSKVTLTEADFHNADGTSKVTFESGKNKVELKYGVDFEIVEGSYKNNVKKGTASVTLKGKGAYGGTKTIKFKVRTRDFGEWSWWGRSFGE